MAGIDQVAPDAAAERIAGDVQAFGFSTDAFRPHERIAAWRELFGLTLLKIDVTPLSREGFWAHARGLRAPGIGVIRASMAAVDSANSTSLICNDDISFGCSLSGDWRASQLGRSAALGRGDGVLMSNSDLGRLTLPQNCRFVTFGLPRSVLAALVPDLGPLFANGIPAANPALRMLLRYLELADEEILTADPELRNAFGTHVCDLLALALGATRDATELARGRGATAARLRAMQDDIRKAAHRPDLTVHMVAAHHGVSPRYVQRLFEESGSTFTKYLTEQRLTAAYKALRRRAATDVPISAIALDCGFSDVSHFNRLFRQRFGCAPGDVRKTARSSDA